jgi:simple sugar transport system permease protein
LFTVLAVASFIFFLVSIDSVFNFNFQSNTDSVFFEIPVVHLPTRITIIVLTIIEFLVCGLSYYYAFKRKKMNISFTIIFALCWVMAFLVWQIQGEGLNFYATGFLATALALSVPLVFGSMSGVVCEHVGVVNIAIEGQLLFGAFAATICGSIAKELSGSEAVGLAVGFIAAPVSGLLLGSLFALFTVKYFVNQMIVGVLINVLSLGLTSYLYSTLMSNHRWLNQAMKLPIIRIPLLSEIPILGPVFFNQSVMVYLMFAVVILLQVFLFHSRWGLRMRACGEHPKAADTVGINVNRTRFRNVVLGSAIAGLGGGYFTIAQGLVFNENISSGKGYIALAAMIMGKWKPNTALVAACIFGFADAVQILLSVLGAPIPGQFLLMMPYLVTIFAIAGIIGKVIAPAQEGKPYIG